MKLSPSTPQPPTPLDWYQKPMNKIAPQTRSVKSISLVLMAMVALTACTTPRPEAAVKVYDFGPASLQTAAAGYQACLATLVLFAPQAVPAKSHLPVLVGCAAEPEVAPVCVWDSQPGPHCLPV